MTDEEPAGSSMDDDGSDGDHERSATRDRPSEEPAGGRNPDEDPAEYLPADVTREEFEAVVEAATTILDVQRELRLSRWKVKRLLHRTGRWDEVETPAQRVEELRDGDYSSDR